MVCMEGCIVLDCRRNRRRGFRGLGAPAAAKGAKAGAPHLKPGPKGEGPRQDLPNVRRSPGKLRVHGAFFRRTLLPQAASLFPLLVHTLQTLIFHTAAGIHKRRHIPEVFGCIMSAKIPPIVSSVPAGKLHTERSCLSQDGSLDHIADTARSGQGPRQREGEEDPGHGRQVRRGRMHSVRVFTSLSSRPPPLLALNAALRS